MICKFNGGHLGARSHLTMPSRVRIDELDQKIIRALQNDARTSFTDIAKSCGVSTDTVSKRFRRLRRIGVIVRATLWISNKGFGFEHLANFGIRVEYPHLEEVFDSLRRMPQCHFCTLSMGRYNIIAYAATKDLESLARLKEQVENHPAVREVAMNFLIDVPPPIFFDNIEFECNSKKWERDG
jgi:Lrp/AsnC family transcriptional regulator for asnA, asnC and gidA